MNELPALVVAWDLWLSIAPTIVLLDGIMMTVV